jgi:hypothetical protein
MLRFLMPLARLPAHMLAVVSLYYFIVGSNDDNRRLDQWFGTTLIALVSGLACWICTIAGAEPVLFPVGGALMLPFAAGILLFMMVEAYEKAGLQEAFDGRWRLFQLETVFDVLPSPRVPEIPDHLKRRIESAWDIPGTKVYLDWLGTDPFVVVRRGYGIFAEEHIVGAYATGNRLLDNFGH